MYGLGAWNQRQLAHLSWELLQLYMEEGKSAAAG